MSRVLAYLAVGALTVGLPFGAEVGMQVLHNSTAGQDGGTPTLTPTSVVSIVETSDGFAEVSGAVVAWIGLGALSIAGAGAMLAFGRRPVSATPSAAVSYDLAPSAL